MARLGFTLCTGTGRPHIAQHRRLRYRVIGGVLLVMCALLYGRYLHAAHRASFTQSPALLMDEARTVYLGNLAREAEGLTPLRWNRNLTEASRWFSWDSVENRPEPYCGHQDSQGHWPDWRARAFGYTGFAGAENAYCGYVTPEQAIRGWLDSPGHRANLLDPNSREIGLGYYRRAGDLRGYVAQMFGHDPLYAPVIINNEAITTTSSQVDLYIYDREESANFGAATEMMISQDPCFNDSSWQPYVPRQSWTLPAEEGWHTVYVRTRDRQGRVLAADSTIYLGSEPAPEDIAKLRMTEITNEVTLYGLDGGNLSMVQFSPSWFFDDTHKHFSLLWGAGERIADADAWGGSAFRLNAGAGETAAWVWTTLFAKETPLVAYFRLKIDDNGFNQNGFNQEVARITVKGGGVTYGPLSLHSTDFAAANQYQEFLLPFTFHDNPDDVFLIFDIARTGNAQIDVDGISVFTQARASAPAITWQIPGSVYRGQGIWIRYTDGGPNFTTERILAETVAPGLEASSNGLTFSGQNDTILPTQTLDIRRLGCRPLNWQAHGDQPWLQVASEADRVLVTPDVRGLAAGVYQGAVVIQVPMRSDIPVLTVPVTLTVTGGPDPEPTATPEDFPIYLPMIDNF